MSQKQMPMLEILSPLGRNHGYTHWTGMGLVCHSLTQQRGVCSQSLPAQSCISCKPMSRFCLVSSSPMIPSHQAALFHTGNWLHHEELGQGWACTLISLYANSSRLYPHGCPSREGWTDCCSDAQFHNCKGNKAALPLLWFWQTPFTWYHGWASSW